MKKTFFLLLFCTFITGTTTANLGAAETFDGDESLIFMEIPSVITASKKKESVALAPSVVYVVTSEEIKRSGARSLAEVLKRVPGFHISVRETSILGGRGFTSDQIDKFVWLIDGAPITNIMQDGPWGIMDIPDMDMVDRVEIVKGPSSTLWGSNASLGVINIITKSGEQVNGTIPSFSISSRDNQSASNVLYGGKTSGGADYMFSLTFTRSGGFNDTNDGYNRVYNWGGTTQNTGYDNYKVNNLGRNGNLLRIEPSWEFYGKVKNDEGITVKTRAVYTRMGYLWGDNNDGQHQDTVFKHAYTEFEKENSISDTTDLTNKLNIHTLAYDRGILTQAVDPLGSTDIETKTEMGISFESILKTVISDKHSIVAGIKAQSVQFGPSQRHQFMVGTTSTTLNGGYPIGYKYVYVTDAGLDNTYGIYLEDSFSVTDRLTLVGGMSYEYNDFVEVGGKAMPRGAVIYSFNDKWSLKHCFNTGYERPPVDKKFHKVYGHVEKSEDVQESDTQLSYNGDKTRFSLTGFSYMIFNYFTWIQVNDANGNMLTQGHGNNGEGKSIGAEFDIRHNLTNSLSLSGNYTYADTKINDAYPIGDPKHLYNIGADYYFSRDVSVNVNMNGWRDMPNGYPDDGTWSGSGEQLVDLTIVTDNVGGKPLTLTLFAHNLFNVSSRVGMTGWPGYTYAKGSSYGIKTTYKF